MTRKTFYFDLLERALWTFAQTFLATLFVDGTVGIDLPADDKVKLALAAGVAAVVKGVMVNQLPWTAANSASTLPAEVDPPADEGGQAN